MPPRMMLALTRRAWVRCVLVGACALAVPPTHTRKRLAACGSSVRCAESLSRRAVKLSYARCAASRSCA